jgi:hypothetical protein
LLVVSAHAHLDALRDFPFPNSDFFRDL